MNLQSTINSITSLPVSDRLRVVAAVWDSLEEDVVALDALSPEQRAELNRRLDDLDANPDDLLTWDEVLKQVCERE